ncbi:MAG TPA: IS701 family transposase [Anaerolineales bacterium]|nr:IS701 family transposase [Anaerolineales bacterium]
MTEAQVERCRKRLEQFLVDLLQPVGRSERRHWGSVYVRGLLLNGERKSIEPIAARLPEGNIQAMQQFIGQSPWEWHSVWERLARRMTNELEPEPAWIIDDTGFPKQGQHSVGVERQYSGTLGKVANCQVAVSLHHVGQMGSAVLAWRLYLPESWANDQARREEAGIPADIRFKSKWQLAFELIDQARGWELPDRIVIADAGYGDTTEFRDGLEARQLSYVVGVSANLGVWAKPPKVKIPEYRGRGAPATRYDYGAQRPSSVRDVALKAKGWKKVRWREGTKGWLESRFLAVRVRPSHGFVDGKPPHREVWLLGQWPQDEEEPMKYFLADLPPTYSLRRLVRAAKSRWKIEQDYQQLKEELGLDHYEGRSWAGWHHHVTLVMLAHAFLTLETLRGKKNFWLDPAEDTS